MAPVSTASTFWHDIPGPRAGAAKVVRRPVSMLLRAAWQVRVHGYERIPTRGPVILAANHTGILDGPLLYAVMRRSTYALVKQEMFTGAIGWMLRSIGQIPVDRYGCDLAAVKASLAVLHRGETLAIYPEGTRGTGDFQQIKSGLAYFALCTGAPIVPVACLGVRTPTQSIGRLPRLRSNVDVVFGQPIETEPIGWPRRRSVVEERANSVAEQLREHVRHACLLTGQRLPNAPH